MRHRQIRQRVEETPGLAVRLFVPDPLEDFRENDTADAQICADPLSFSFSLPPAAPAGATCLGRGLVSPRFRDESRTGDPGRENGGRGERGLQVLGVVAKTGHVAGVA